MEQEKRVEARYVMGTEVRRKKVTEMECGEAEDSKKTELRI